ncbi:tetratricopeptide repeat protein [Flavobacterium sp. ACAM 123]|jgi:tetratricopeptide (TPR) repeat protein|uniref:tetratricopeptide repeat protein n=1 Tax=Flavobacterium sp. ACAM 123 TaxID=1189620 RepID=UPI000302977C|nr:tetratricopeptide repeat protein [Flavobacterium sp. ACAM 123]
MKKNLALILLFVLNFHVSTSQSLEEKAATETCNCLAKYDKPSEKNFSECIGNSFAKVFFEEKDEKIREKANTVEGITQIIKEVSALLPKTCDALKEKRNKDQKELLYSDSEIESAKNYYSIAKDMMMDSKYDLAIKSFQMAIGKDKNYVLAYDDMAACYRQLGDYDSAIKYYKKSLEIFPEGDFALMNIGVVYTLKSDFKTAVSYYEKLIKFRPKNAEGYFGAAKNYFVLKEYEKALDNIFIAHRIYTNDNSSYIKDSEQIMGAMYQQLKSENKEALFLKIAKKNNMKIE